MQQPRPTPPPPQSSSVYASLYAQYLAYYRSMGYDPATAHQAAHSYASQAAAASSTNPSTADNPMIQQQQHYRHQQQPQYIKVQPKTSTTSAVAVNIPKSSTATTTTATAWPDSLKRYVASVFQLTRPHQKAAVEAELKLLIKQHSATLHSTDWDKMPMLKSCSAMDATNDSRQQEQQTIPKLTPFSKLSPATATTAPSYVPPPPSSSFATASAARQSRFDLTVHPSSSRTSTASPPLHTKSSSTSSPSYSNALKKSSSSSSSLNNNNNNTLSSSYMDIYQLSSAAAAKKRKSPATDHLMTSNNNAKHAKKGPSTNAASIQKQKQHQKSLLDESSSSSSSDDDDDDIRSSGVGAVGWDEEQQRRAQRAQRFEQTDKARRKEVKKQQKIAVAARSAFIAAGADGNPDVVDWDEDTIIGTCEKLEKNYLRLTSAPDPSTVRPLHILRKTLALLVSKWQPNITTAEPLDANINNYTYMCTQFKSLRQDLTVQRIKNTFTVQVYETHARIALQKGDLGEYNQCQAQLITLYALGIKGCEEEFVGYRILYFLHTLNRSALAELMSSLTPTQKSHPNIRHALAVRAAIARTDYYTLFSTLLPSAPDQSADLMTHFVHRERTRAMTVMCRAYLPSLEIGFVVRMLGFHQQVAAAMATTTTTMSKKKSSSAAATTAAATAITAAASKAFRKWINEVGKPYGCVLGKKEMHVETKPWLNKCFAVIEASGLKIDLKGQI